MKQSNINRLLFLGSFLRYNNNSLSINFDPLSNNNRVSKFISYCYRIKIRKNPRNMKNQLYNTDIYK